MLELSEESIAWSILVVSSLMGRHVEIRVSVSCLPVDGS